MTRLFLICLSLAIICTSCIANAEPIDDYVLQFKEDQIKCLKIKVALNEESVALLVVMEMFKEYIRVDKGGLTMSVLNKKINEMDARYNQIIKLKQNYTCEDDADNKFLDEMGQ